MTLYVIQSFNVFFIDLASRKYKKISKKMASPLKHKLPRDLWEQKIQFLLYLVTIVKYLISAYFYVHEKVFVVLSIPFLRKSMLYFFFFFSSSDRIVYSVFLYTLALLKGRYSDQVFFFYKRFESNTENCSKYLYCPHCIHSPCMTVMLCFWYFSFS